jgi:hypothetical protein
MLWRCEAVFTAQAEEQKRRERDGRWRPRALGACGEHEEGGRCGGRDLGQRSFTCPTSLGNNYISPNSTCSPAICHRLHARALAPAHLKPPHGSHNLFATHSLCTIRSSSHSQLGPMPATPLSASPARDQLLHALACQGPSCLLQRWLPMTQMHLLLLKTQ